MSNGINLLSDRFIKKAPVGDHYDGGGLIYHVTPNGKKVFRLRFRFDGSRTKAHLGEYPAISLAEARARRDEARGWLEQGLDPRAMWQRERDAINEVVEELTFGQFAEAELPRLTAHLISDKSRKQWFSTIRTYGAPIWNMPIDEVTDRHVAECLADQWTTKHETMSKTRARMQKIFRAAKRKKHVTGDNPAALENVEDYFAKPSRDDLRVRHHPAHDYRDMPDFFNKLSERDATSALAFRFKILTAARTSEVREMTWDEIDFENGIWNVPAERMKVGRPHDVPLSRLAIEILESIEGERTGYVFKSENGKHAMSNGAMLMLIKRMGDDAINRKDERVTPHGCARSSFKDWAMETTNYPDELSEVALAHVDTAVKRSYRRESAVEKRRAMMNDWADHLIGAARGKVVAFPAA